MTAVVPLMTCTHVPPCPRADAVDHDAAKVIADHHEQGWVLLCGGIVVYDDTGETLPDGRAIGPHRPEPEHCTDQTHGHACLCETKESRS